MIFNRKLIIVLMPLVLLFLFSSNANAIKGTVVDAEIGKPIEGAIVLVEWSSTSGKWIGLRTTSRYKIVETETDDDGRFSIPRTYNPLVNAPIVIIYKSGYVAWRNDLVFPSYKKRDDFQWQNNYVFRLSRFAENYSKEEHYYFFDTGIIGDSFERTPKFSNIIIKLSKDAREEIDRKKTK